MRIERMEPRQRPAASYYERSLTSLATLLVEKGVVTHAELEQRAGGRFPLSEPGRRGPDPTPKRTSPSGRAIASACGTITSPATCACRATSAARQVVVVGQSPAYPFPDAHAHALAAEDEPTCDVRSTHRISALRG